METFEIFLFTSLIVSSIWLIFVVISISNENAKLKERLRNEPESTYNVWLRALSNNLPMILDNQHGKETKGKKCPWDWDLYHLDFVKEARIVENEKLENQIKRLKVDVEEYSKAAKYWKSQYDLKPYEMYLDSSFQKQEFEAKEKKYVEKIRQLEKILVAEEIALSVDGKVTNMKADKLKYEKYELNLEKSNLQKEVEKLNSLLEMAKVVMTVTKEDDNVLDIVDKILAEEKTTERGYNTVTTLKNKKSK